MDVRETSNTAGGKPPLVSWAESFIFAGSSAFLLLVANLFPAYWYFSFVALTPFLYKIIKATPSESLRLGFLFGLSFFGASELESFHLLVDSPEIFSFAYWLLPIKLISGIGLFGLFGWVVGWARQRWGFNPTIVALLWVGLELGLMKLGVNQNGSYLGFIGGLFGKAEFSYPFFGSLVTLLGFLTVSAIIVLLNSLLALAIAKTLEIIRTWGKAWSRSGCEATRHLFSTPGLFTQKVYLVPEGRAPPRIDV